MDSAGLVSTEYTERLTTIIIRQPREQRGSKKRAKARTGSSSSEDSNSERGRGNQGRRRGGGSRGDDQEVE